jgi:hypothetical protein
MTTNPTLEWAIHYAENGYRVIPIKPNQKRPPVAAWQDVATTNTGTITQWFTGIYQDHGIGIVTGENDQGWRFIVLDIDNKDSDTGSRTLAELQQQNSPLPDTVTAITGGGGMHLLYRLADHHPMPSNGAGRYLGESIDIRGHNAQILVAPTTHPNGNRYEWADGHAIGEIAVAEAPDWLLALLNPQEQPATPLEPRESNGSPTEDTGDTRAGTLFNRATRWDDLLLADGWQPHHLDHGNTQHWTRPAKAVRDGVSATVNHNDNDKLTVFTTAINNLPAGTYDRFGYWVATRYQGNFTQAARDLSKQNNQDRDTDIRAWLQVIQNQDTDQSVLEIPADQDHTPALTSWFIEWQSFWAADQTDTEWLVEPILAKTRGHALYAGAKSGKSLMLLEIAAALATGKAVLNSPAREPMHVLYVDYEMSAQDIKDRLEAFGYTQADDLTHLHYVLLPSIGGLDTPEGAKTIIDAVHHYGIQLVVIDTTARAVEGAENDADTLRAFYRWTGLALKSKKCTYIRADHAGKDTSKGQRGTSAKNDDVDVVWRFTKRGADNILLEATHRRMSWIPERVEIELRDTPDGLRHTTIQDKPSMAAMQMAHQLRVLGMGTDTTLTAARKTLKERNIKCAQDTLRAALRMMKNDAVAAMVENAQDNALHPTSRTFGDETRLAERLAPSDTETTPRLGNVSPRLDTASHETQTTLYKERLASDQPNPDIDLGLF